MPLMKLQFQPGLNREVTAYSDEGGWWDADKVRFRMGYPEKIGGWVKNNPAPLLGTCRAIHPWVALDNNEYIGFGTSQKYYVSGGGNYNDITPLRNTTPVSITSIDAAFTTLASGVSLTETASITLTSVTGFSTSGGLIKIDNEQIRYGAISGSTLTSLQRGQNGTAAAAHLTSADVFCATLIVTDTAHGALQNDFVTIAGAVSLGGNITAAVMNQEYQITQVLTPSVYTIEARTVSTIASITGPTGLVPTYVFPNTSDTGTGSTGITGEYQINTGLNTSIGGTGWGAGVWGGIGTGGTSSPPTTTGWGDPAATTTSGSQLRLWNHDNFGQNLLFNVSNGGIYYWAKSTAYPRAVELTSLAGATTGKAPTIAKQVLISDNDRHALAFGCDDEFSIGTQDPLLIRFSEAENVTEWRSLATNDAGSIKIGSGSYIVTAVETKQQILVITDTSVHALQYLGPPFTFGLTMVSDNISITSPNAAIAVDDSVYWMGEGDFYIYNGTVTQIPCDVKDYVFSRIDPQQTQKVVAGANINFGEVWWFYQSNTAGVTDNDSYVVYNYQQKVWYFGTLTRTAWTHKNLGIYPIAASPADNYVYLHEQGFDDGSKVAPNNGITAFIESTGQDLGDGDSFAFIWRMIPDLTFRNSTAVSPQATFTVMMSNFPGTDFSQTNANVVTKTSSYTVEEFTPQVYTRLRGRSFTFKISSTAPGVGWRLGAPRLDVRTDGRR
jgi:hypothetical protein